MGYAEGVDLKSLLLLPVSVPLRLAEALDDLAAIADRARREPDPVEEVRERLDALLAEIVLLRTTAAGLNVTGRDLIDGGADLTDTAKALKGDTAELIDGGQDLTDTAKRLDVDLRTLQSFLPRLVQALDTLERLEDEIETVAETVEPLQGAAERVGRMTRRLSRSNTP